MSNLQQVGFPEVDPPKPQPCEWCGGTAGHYGWCERVMLTNLHTKIDNLTKEINALNYQINALNHEIDYLQHTPKNQ